jgi:16S rRNA (guanine966-N2)-methyltransferase
MRRPDPARAPRILAGRLRGRALLVPAGRVTRPVRALVRRSIFDSLQDRIEGARWLDLFAGSGAFGIEALSRGAAHATFVEADGEGLRCLKENLARLKLAPPQAAVIAARLPDLLRDSPPAPAPYEFISLDPPFAVSRTPSELARLVEALRGAGPLGWWRPGALLLWEEPSDAPAPLPGGFVEESVRLHGASRVRRLRCFP